jgi:hypothetical protein
MLSGCDFSGTVTVAAPATGAINVHKPAAHVNLWSNGVPCCDSREQAYQWSRGQNIEWGENPLAEKSPM